MGYTLIEILIVVALLSLILSISIPGLGFLNRTREANELKEFKRDLLYTRNKAIVDRKTYRIKIDYTNNEYLISNFDYTPIKLYKFTYGIKINKDSNIKEFTFGMYGSPSVGGTICLSDSRNNNFEIAITPVTGKITLRKAD